MGSVVRAPPYRQSPEPQSLRRLALALPFAHGCQLPPGPGRGIAFVGSASGSWALAGSEPGALHERQSVGVHGKFWPLVGARTEVTMARKQEVIMTITDPGYLAPIFQAIAAPAPQKWQNCSS